MKQRDCGGQVQRVGIVVVLAGVCLLTACETTPAMHRASAEQALRQKDLATARQHYLWALEKEPIDWKAQIGLGQVLLKQEQWLDAQFAFEKALELRPNNPETSAILDGLAESLHQQGREDELRSMLARAVKDYGMTEDYLREGKYLALLGDADSAKVALMQAAERASLSDIRPYQALVSFAERIGDQSLAIDALRRAHGLKPRDARISSQLRHYGIVPGPAAALPPYRPGVVEP